MSQFACSADGRRIKGSASTAYVALVNGSYSSRAKKRFCEDHGLAFRFVVDDVAELVWIDDQAQIEEGTEILTCRRCGKDAGYTLFVDLFLRGEPSRSFRARYCDTHVGDVSQKVSVEP
jgi:hypothetical protein